MKNKPYPQKNKQAIKKLLAEIKRYIPALIIALFGYVGTVIIGIILPNQMGDISQHIADACTPIDPTFTIFKGTLDLKYVERQSILIASLFIVSSLLNYLGNFIMVTISQRFCNALRTKIIEKVNSLPLSYFDNNKIGDTMSIVTNDVDSISQNFADSFFTFLLAIIMLIGSSIMMFTTSWLMALVCVATIPVMIVVLSINMFVARPSFKARQKQIGVLNGVIEEQFGGQTITRLFNAEEREHESFNKENKYLGKLMFKAQIMGGMMMPMSNLLANLSYIAVMVVGGLCAIEGKYGINFKVITAFIIYVRLFQQPFQEIANALNMFQSVSAASGRVFDFLGQNDVDDLNIEGEKLLPENLRGEVSFKNVCFSYDETREIIHDFSADIKPGMKVAIVGPTGAGKTTMVNLLMRFYDTKSGSIYIDGVDIKKMNRSDLRELFGMVLQDSWIFEGSLKDNLVYNSKDVSDEKIEEVLKEANLDHFVETLPGGVNYLISDSSQISSGQKQLITIARAMIRNSPMLILDEATSNVDTRTEILIQEAMDKLSEGRTSFVIAHRLSTIKNADLILVMKDGNIVETGNHESLLKQNGFYASIYNSQFVLE